jgi:hypothetical protein
MNFFDFKSFPFYGLLTSAVLLFLFLLASPLDTPALADKMVFGAPAANVVWFFPLFIFVVWLLYVVFDPILFSAALNRWHIRLTLALSLVLGLVLITGMFPSQSIKENFEMVGLAVQLLSLGLVLSQTLPVINLILGLLQRLRV